MAKANKGKWTISGINVTSSDSIYQELVKAIQSGNLSEKHLQKITGSNAPILVNIPERTIQFCAW